MTMQTIQTLVAIAAGLLGILGVVVAVTKRWSRAESEVEKAKLADENRVLAAKLEAAEARREKEKEVLAAQVAALEDRRDQLLEQISVNSRAGSAALAQKAELDVELQGLMKKMQASGGSLYVPVHSPRGEVQGLAFLSIEPFTVKNQALRTKLIPLKSMAGRCFSDGRSFIVTNAEESPDRFKAAAAIADYRPSTTANVALREGDQTVGVLQLLRAEGEPGFCEADIERVQAMLGGLAVRVAGIARTPEYLKLLGVGGEAAPETGTALYFDLSHSALLFQELSPSFALQLLNDYFECVCEEGFHEGATVDNYMGDGGLLRFNVPRAVAEHELAAVRAGIAMNRAFAKMKDEYWATISPRLARLHHRSAVASGPLQRATLGHSQVQHLTVIGHTIAVAAALCQTADRDCETLVISGETYAAVRERVVAEPVPVERLGKAALFTGGAYEVRGLR